MTVCYQEQDGTAPGSKRPSKLHKMYQRRCTAKISWWWAERLPETCRVVIPINLEFGASVGYIHKARWIISSCTYFQKVGLSLRCNRALFEQNFCVQSLDCCCRLLRRTADTDGPRLQTDVSRCNFRRLRHVLNCHPREFFYTPFQAIFLKKG